MQDDNDSDSCSKNPALDFFSKSKDFICRFLNTLKKYETLWKIPATTVAKRKQRDKDYAKMAKELEMDEYLTICTVLFVIKYKKEHKTHKNRSDEYMKYHKLLSFLDDKTKPAIPNIERFTCPKCRKIFTESQDLEKHLKERHVPKEIILECEYCQKRFNSKSDLTIHIRIHTKERPYICPHCGNSFKTSSQLSNHEKSHSDPEYHCSICSKSFHLKHKLTAHLKLHLNTMEYKCPFCDMAFNSNKSLYRHKTKLHLNEHKTYCRQCGSCFDNLEEHINLQHNVHKRLVQKRISEKDSS